MPKTPTVVVRETEKRQGSASASRSSSHSSSTFATPLSSAVEQTTSGSNRKDASRRSLASPESGDLVVETPQDCQLFVEDLAANQGNKLILVKIPPGVDVSSLVGKRISNKKKRIIAEVNKRGEKVKVELTACQQEASDQDELKKWSVFLPSRQDGDAYHFVSRRLEGSLTLNYSSSKSGKHENTS